MPLGRIRLSRPSSRSAGLKCKRPLGQTRISDFFAVAGEVAQVQFGGKRPPAHLVGAVKRPKALGADEGPGPTARRHKLEESCVCVCVCVHVHVHVHVRLRVCVCCSPKTRPT